MTPSLMLRIMRFYSTEFLVYPLETLALVLRRVFTVGLLLFFWHLVARDNEVRGVQAVPYILVASGINYLAVGQNFLHAYAISDDIKFGRLNNLLIRPVNELRYELGMHIGRNVLEYGFSLINIVAGLWFASGLSAERLGLFAVSLVSAVLIGYALNIMVAALAFWIIDITYTRLILFFILRVVSGMFLPLTLFSGFWAWLQYSPVAQLAFVPGYVITGDDTGRAVMFVLAGLVQAPLVFGLARLVWRKGLGRYSAVGI